MKRKTIYPANDRPAHPMPQKVGPALQASYWCARCHDFRADVLGCGWRKIGGRMRRICPNCKAKEVAQ